MPILTEAECSLSDYHSSPYISHSKLRDYAQRGPQYFASRHVTREKKREPPTDAMVFGQAFEDLVYGLPVADRYAIKLEGMTFSTKEGKTWRAEALAAGRPIISRDDYELMYEMRDALLENKTAMRMIAACGRQVTFRAEYIGTPGIQARPDWYSADGCLDSGHLPFTLDLKTTANLDKLASGRSVVDYGYHSQAGLAGLALAGNGLGCPRMYLLAIEKTEPYRSQVIEIPDSWLVAGQLWCDKQLAKLVARYSSGHWPRMEREMIELPRAPEWVSRQAVNESEEE